MLTTAPPVTVDDGALDDQGALFNGDIGAGHYRWTGHRTLSRHEQEFPNISQQECINFLFPNSKKAFWDLAFFFQPAGKLFDISRT